MKRTILLYGVCSKNVNNTASGQSLLFLHPEFPRTLRGNQTAQEPIRTYEISLPSMVISDNSLYVFHFQTSVTDVLKAMGAMPSGFRSTTLGKMNRNGR